MAVIGRSLLILAFLVSIYGIVASVYGTFVKNRLFTASGRNALFVVAGLVVAAFGLLEVAFLRNDFSLKVVAEHSSTTTTAFYKATAAWSSQEGSLLLWALLLGIFSSAVVASSYRKFSGLVPIASAVLLFYSAFFLAMMIFFANPFEQLAQIPAEGKGLNPLLRHPSMMFHPPALYAGYTLISIPFAFAISALVTGRLDSVWLRATRRYTLAGWMALTIGILLGARWSYAELGWGGYWAWDPVENAALMPWLIGTAFLHSSLIQEKRGMLKIWNVSLVLAMGVLAILGTFLVRSGIISSIHAFGASTLGIPFVVLISLLTFASVVLVVLRHKQLSSKQRIDSWLSREAVFLFNNLLLVALCAVIFWGTFFPLISEAVTGNQAAVGPPWFDRYVVPLALLLVLFAGIGPAIPWRKATPIKLLKSMALPLAAVLLELLLLLLWGVDNPYAVVAFLTCTFAAATALQELIRAAVARSRTTKSSFFTALFGLVSRNRRRYGGYIAHIGIAVLFIGIAGSSAFQDVRDVTLLPGQSTTVNGYQFNYTKPKVELSGERIAFGADVEVKKLGKTVTKLHPNRGYYPSLDVENLGVIGRFFDGEATSEIGLKAGFRKDIWVAVQPDISKLQPMIDEADRRFKNPSSDLQGVLIGAIAQRYIEKPEPLRFRVMVSPLVTWIWIGGIIIGIGALIGIWPSSSGSSKAANSRYVRKLATELQSRES